jgi:hypothetical protein
MASWYCTRESVKRAIGATGASRDGLIDQHIGAASRTIDKRLGKRVAAFFPETKTHLFDAPQCPPVSTQVLRLDEGLLSIASLKTSNSTVTIAADDYFLEPNNTGPPYKRIEIDLGDDVAAGAVFQADDSRQRAVAVEGLWGYGDDTEAAGTVRDDPLTDSATSLLVSDGSLIGVGQTILIGTEAIFVSGRTNAAQENTDLLDGALTATQSEVSVTVDDGSRYNAGEVILVDSERMFVESISGNILTVIRQYDSSVLAAHDNDTGVHVFRTLTIVRGVHGTTAAAHVQTTAITKYAPPADIETLCQAEAIFNYEQDRAGHSGIIGGIEGVSVNPNRLRFLWEKAIGNYGEVVFA